jgi:hypothetical protein
MGNISKIRIQNTDYAIKDSRLPDGTSSQFVKGDGSLDSNTYAGAQTSGGAANKAVSIPFGQVDSTSTSTAFTATVDGITELRDGVCVYLKNGIITSASGYTININNLGAKPVYHTMAAATASTNQWNVNYTMLFIYNSTRVSGGCWDMYYGYYSDANTRGYEILEYYSNKKVKTACQRSQILLTCMDGYLLPVYSGTYTTGTSKILTTEKFNPNGQVYYYGSTGILEANATPANGTLFTQAAYNNFVDLRYSFNTGTTLIAGNDIYLVCVPQNDGSAILHTSPIAFALPSTEDGLIYKRLGKAYDTYRLSMEQDKPCYYYKNGAINLWTGTGTQTDVSKSTESNIIDVGGYDLMKINEVKGKSLVMNQLMNTSFSVYSTGKISISTSGTKCTVTDINYEGTGGDPIMVQLSTGVINTHVYLVLVEFELITGAGITAPTYEGGVLAGEMTLYKNNVYYRRFTATVNNSKSYLKVAGTKAIGDSWSFDKARLFDLTQMFGEGNEPTTVEEVEAILGDEYYEYNTGEVVGNSVEKLDVTGFNMLRLTGRTEYATSKNPTDKWNFLSEHIVIKGMSVNGYCRPANIINYSISADSVTVKTSTSDNAAPYGLGFPLRVTPNTSYYFTNTVPTGVRTGITWFDNDGYFISYITSLNNTIFTPPANACWCVIIFIPFAIDTEATFTNPVFNLSNTSKNGTYEPYKHSEFPLNLTELTGKVNGEGTSVTIFPDGLHGVGNVFDSLIVDEDGYARRAIKRMAKVDIGTFTWNTTSTESRFYASLPADATVYTAINNVFKKTYFCDKYTKSTTLTDMTDKTTFLGNNSYMYAQDSSYSTAASFKTAMSGVMLYYELDTPIEYVLDTPVQCVAKVYPNGTVKQVPVMPDSTPMVMDVTYLRDNGLYATKEYVNDAIADKADAATTLAGYGITDAKIEDKSIILGENSITPIEYIKSATEQFPVILPDSEKGLMYYDTTLNKWTYFEKRGSEKIFHSIFSNSTSSPTTEMGTFVSRDTDTSYDISASKNFFENPCEEGKTYSFTKPVQSCVFYFTNYCKGTTQDIPATEKKIQIAGVTGGTATYTFMAPDPEEYPYIEMAKTGDGTANFRIYEKPITWSAFATEEYVDDKLGNIETLLASI